MFVLVVEDEQDWVEAISRALAGFPGSRQISVAYSRDAALQRLDREFFDLVLLDLRIPTTDGALDADPKHGQAVFAALQQKAPGTPCFVLTGSPAEDFIQDLLGGHEQVDIWGQGQKLGTVEFLKKYRFEEVRDKLGPFVRGVSALSEEVELDRGDMDLSVGEDRLIRIFARRFKGRRCVISALGPGLSGSKVMRLLVTAQDGGCVLDAVAKIGSRDDIRDEAARFDNYVVRLGPSATPRKLETLEFGAKDKAGVFYGLAGGFPYSAFDFALKHDGTPGRVVGNIEHALHPWSSGGAESPRPIGDIRRRVVDDAALAAIRRSYELSWLEQFEERKVQARWRCVHGDLHGLNVLVDSAEAIVLIDYGDVGDGPVSLDPITLELSLLFHPKGPLRGGTWPTRDQAASWGALQSYLAGCEAADFIRACRDWALRAAAGKREIAATACAYLVRQLKYPETDKELVLALLDGVRAYFEST